MNTPMIVAQNGSAMDSNESYVEFTYLFRISCSGCPELADACVKSACQVVPSEQSANRDATSTIDCDVLSRDFLTS